MVFIKLINKYRQISARFLYLILLQFISLLIDFSNFHFLKNLFLHNFVILIAIYYYYQLHLIKLFL